MPYLTKPAEYFESKPGKTTYYYPNGQVNAVGTWGLTGKYYTKSSMSRSGTNTSPVLLRTAPRVPGGYHYVRKAISVPRGPRLSYKVWAPKLKKYVWARKPIVIYKYVKVKSKVRKPKGNDWPSNSLSYQQYNAKNATEWDTVTGIHADGSKRVVEGVLWENVVIGGSGMGPNPQNYTGINFSNFASTVTKLDAEARGQMLDRVKNQSINLAQAFAERAQTSKMIADAAVRIAKALVALKNGRLSTAASSIFPTNSKQLANDWLIFQYGIKPLLSDLDGMAKHLAENKPVQFDVITSKTEDIPPRKIDGSQIDSTKAIYTEVYESGKVTVKYKVRVRVEGPTLRALGSLGFLNPVALGWEVIPYSFVIDWLLPIGEYLNRLDSFSTVKIVHAHKTVFQQRNVVYLRRFGGKDAAGYVWTRKEAGFQTKSVLVTRTPVSDIPIPPPRFKNPFSSTHILNAIALLSQLRK